ncbi:unnamed protein product [Amoebophrya sp. A25]|nr:unnamed protein product [Amoebophrya sp. A25]|eukprot:GSA25T00026111001.1
MVKGSIEQPVTTTTLLSTKSAVVAQRAVSREVLSDLIGTAYDDLGKPLNTDGLSVTERSRGKQVHGSAKTSIQQKPEAAKIDEKLATLFPDRDQRSVCVVEAHVQTQKFVHEYLPDLVGAAYDEEGRLVERLPVPATRTRGKRGYHVTAETKIQGGATPETVDPKDIEIAAAIPDRDERTPVALPGLHMNTSTLVAPPEPTTPLEKVQVGAPGMMGGGTAAGQGWMRRLFLKAGSICAVCS